MSKTYRSITYGYDGIHPWTNVIDCYGFANTKNEYWDWRKKVGNEEVDPWYFTKYLPELKGVKLKLFNKRDKKPWRKPPRWYKQMREQQFRAKTKQALIKEITEGNSNFPPYIKNDVWNWS